MKWMRERLNRDEGFTLIELMVVVLIIAVLVAIAIPSFLGFRNRAQDRSSQSDLRNVLLAEKAFWTDNAAFSETPADLTSYEPSLTLQTTGETDTSGVYIELSVAGNDDVVCIAEESDSGNVFVILEDAAASGGTFYGSANSSWTAACPTAAGAPASVAGEITWATNGFPAVP